MTESPLATYRGTVQVRSDVALNEAGYETATSYLSDHDADIMDEIHDAVVGALAKLPADLRELLDVRVTEVDPRAGEAA